MYALSGEAPADMFQRLQAEQKAQEAASVSPTLKITLGVMTAVWLFVWTRKMLRK
jgi:hypothetical protein